MRAGEKNKYLSSHVIPGHSQFRDFQSWRKYLCSECLSWILSCSFFCFIEWFGQSNLNHCEALVFMTYRGTELNHCKCVAGNGMFIWLFCTVCLLVVFGILLFFIEREKKESFHVHVLHNIHDFIWVLVTSLHRYLVFSESPRLYSLLVKPFRLLNYFVSCIYSF